MARAGDEYLVFDRLALVGSGARLLYYLTAHGVGIFAVYPDPVTEELPFTTNCDWDGGEQMLFGVFDDLAIFADEGLTVKLCELDAGRVMPVSEGDVLGGGPLSESEHTFEIGPGPFRGECEGAETGYITVAETTVLGGAAWLEPMATLWGPH